MLSLDIKKLIEQGKSGEAIMMIAEEIEAMQDKLLTKEIIGERRSELSY